jgi:single-strand DNA-binding protein
MASYNRIIVAGNLTRDPEIRYVDGGGKAVTKFSLAINRRTKQGDEVLFLDVVAWEQLGERCNQYLKKGQSALVEGRLAIRNYETSDGEKRKAVEVVASDVQFLGSKTVGATAPDDEEVF